MVDNIILVESVDVVKHWTVIHIGELEIYLALSQSIYVALEKCFSRYDYGPVLCDKCVHLRNTCPHLLVSHAFPMEQRRYICYSYIELLKA